MGLGWDENAYRYSCPDCLGSDIQVSMRTWFDANSGEQADIDYEANKAWFCVDCNEEITPVVTERTEDDAEQEEVYEDERAPQCELCGARGTTVEICPNGSFCEECMVDMDGE